MTRATWNDAVLADSDDVVVVDGFTYFLRNSVAQDLLVESPHTSVCGWKGRASYYTVAVDGDENQDAAWYYPTPSAAAHQVEGRIAFWRGVTVVDAETATSESTAGARRPSWLDRLRGRAGTDGSEDHRHDPTTTSTITMGCRAGMGRWRRRATHRASRAVTRLSGMPISPCPDDRMTVRARPTPRRTSVGVSSRTASCASPATTPAYGSRSSTTRRRGPSPPPRR